MVHVQRIEEELRPLQPVERCSRQQNDPARPRELRNHSGRLLVGIDQAVQRLAVQREKVLTNIDRVGNTSSASIPMLLDESIRAGKVKPGDTVLMCALGAGISWGSALVRL